MTAPDLKPCPFCGSEARMWQDPSHSAAWFIGCDDGETACFGAIHWDQTKAEAIAAWNTRTIPLAEALAVPEIKALEALLQEARSDLEIYITNEYPKDKHPYYERQWNRDMELCRRIDAALRAIGEGKA